MSITDAARIAVQVWPGQDAITGVAIAGAESSWRNDARGDPLTAFSAARQEEWLPYSWQGYTSIGLWQIHMPSHRDKLALATGSSDPAVWAAYLIDFIQNGHIAWLVWREGGFNPWTTFRTGDYRAHLDAARAAVNAERLKAGEPTLPRVSGLPTVAVAPPLTAVAPPAVAVMPPAV